MKTVRESAAYVLGLPDAEKYSGLFDEIGEDPLVLKSLMSIMAGPEQPHKLLQAIALGIIIGVEMEKP